MMIKARRVILLGFVAILIPVSILSLQFSDQVPVESLGSTKSPDLNQNEEPMHVWDAWFMLDKLPEGTLPETYVDLTKEDVIMFPVLQAALQSFEESNQTGIGIKTSDKAAFKIDEYICNKFKDQYGNENGYICRYFKYREEYYFFGIAVPEGGVSTSISPQTNTVSEVSSMILPLFLAWVIFFLYAQSKKKLL